MANYAELLDAVDKLLTFVETIKLEPNEKDAKQQVSEADEIRLIALDHVVRTLADSHVLTKQLPWHSTSGYGWTKTGLMYWPWNEKRLSEWREGMMRFRSIVRNLTGDTEGDGTNEHDDIPSEYRAGGIPNGKPLGTRFISDTFGIDKTTITRNLMTRIADPRDKRAHLYSWDSLVRYLKSKGKDANETLAEWQRSTK